MRLHPRILTQGESYERNQRKRNLLDDGSNNTMYRHQSIKSPKTQVEPSNVEYEVPLWENNLVIRKMMSVSTY